MGKLKAKLTDYKNFWLIWLSCAGQENGTSLFRIQSMWDIKTNYLYHNEAVIKKPLFRLMEEEKYIEISGNKIKARFDWIPAYIAESFKEGKATGGYWSPALIVKSRWASVQPFMERHRKQFFDPDNLRLLYRGDRDMLGTYGKFVFQHVFLYVVFSNIIAFSRRYSADIVTKMMATAVSLGSGADVLNYMYQLHSTIGGSTDFPVLTTDEQELGKMLCSLKW
jgi:hypothetical protein